MAYNKSLFETRVYGDRHLLDNLDRMPDTVRAILVEKVRYYAEEIRREVEDNIDARLNKSNKEKEYSGSIYHLRDSVEIDEAEEGERVEAYIYIDPSIPYARILEDGGRTAPHEIYPRNRRILAFQAATGDRAFATRVFHPGASIPAFHYMRDAYRSMSPRIGKAIKKAVVDGIRQSMRNQG